MSFDDLLAIGARYFLQGATTLAHLVAIEAILRSLRTLLIALAIALMTVYDTPRSRAGQATGVVIILGAVTDGTGLELAITPAANDIAQSLAGGTEFRIAVALRTDYNSGAVASPATRLGLSRHDSHQDYC